MFSTLYGDGYSYGFNGMEKDDEIGKGSGSSYDLGFRHYDSRLGKMLSVDPRKKEYPWQSSYVYHRNSPISTVDYLGGGDEKQKVKAYTHPLKEKLKNSMERYKAKYDKTRASYIEYYKSIGKIDENSTEEEIQNAFSNSNKAELSRLKGLENKSRNSYQEAVKTEKQWNKLDREIEDVVHDFNERKGLKGADRLDPNLLKALMFSETELGAGKDYNDLVNVIPNKAPKAVYQLNLGRVTDGNLYNQVVKEFAIPVNWTTNYKDMGNKNDVMLAAGALMIKMEYAQNSSNSLLTGDKWFDAVMAYKGVSGEGLRKARLVWKLYQNGSHPYTTGLKLY